MINTVKSLVEPAALRFISYIHRNEAFHADPLVSRTYFSSSFDQMTGEKFHFQLGLGKTSKNINRKFSELGLKGG